MRWRHLSGGSASILEATRRLATFVAEQCAHCPYAADWDRQRRSATTACSAARHSRISRQLTQKPTPADEPGKTAPVPPLRSCKRACFRRFASGIYAADWNARYRQP